ncbi:hypothetical protein B7463_g4346, partial [Scytalidium lignicola]
MERALRAAGQISGRPWRRGEFMLWHGVSAAVGALVGDLGPYYFFIYREAHPGQYFTLAWCAATDSSDLGSLTG